MGAAELGQYSLFREHTILKNSEDSMGILNPITFHLDTPVTVTAELS